MVAEKQAGMRATLRLIEREEDIRALQSVWNGIVEGHSDGILGLDVTSTFEWARALASSFLDTENQEILLLEVGGEAAGILPLFCSAKTVHAVKCRRISPLTELYGGRCGFLLGAPQVDHLEALFEYLKNELSGWDVFLFSLVDGSPSHALLLELEKRRGFRCERILTQTTPYIEFAGTWREYFASLPKKFRWNLRDAEKRMRARSEIRYEAFERGSDLERFTEAMLEIERASWKEAAGTSVTANPYQEAFYREILPVAAEKGWFSGHLLELKGEPIAYICGLRFNNAFSDLKESYKHQYRELSPGHVLKMFAFQGFHEQKVGLYDFMGLCENYKMRWTDKTYSRSIYVFYNKTARGRAAQMLGKLIPAVKRAGKLWSPLTGRQRVSRVSARSSSGRKLHRFAWDIFPRAVVSIPDGRFHVRNLRNR